MRRSSIFFRLASFLCCFSALARSRSRARRAAAGAGGGFTSATGAASAAVAASRSAGRITCALHPLAADSTRRRRRRWSPHSARRLSAAAVAARLSLRQCSAAGTESTFSATTSATLTAAGGASLRIRGRSGSDLRSDCDRSFRDRGRCLHGVPRLQLGRGRVSVANLSLAAVCRLAVLCLRWEPVPERPPDPGQSASSRSSRSSAKSPATAAADRPVH